MARHDVVAFYKENKQEISFYSENLIQTFDWKIRYEQLPENPKSIVNSFDEETAMCIINRQKISFDMVIKYVYALNRPVLLISQDSMPLFLNNICMPINYTKESKGLTAWANFLQRTNSSSNQIRVVVPKENDGNFIEGISDNLFFTKKVLTDSSARFNIVRSDKNYNKTLVELLSIEGMVVLSLRPERALIPIFEPFLFKKLREYPFAQVLIIPSHLKLVPCH